MFKRRSREIELVLEYCNTLIDITKRDMNKDEHETYKRHDKTVIRTLEGVKDFITFMGYVRQ